MLGCGSHLKYANGAYTSEKDTDYPIQNILLMWRSVSKLLRLRRFFIGFLSRHLIGLDRAKITFR
jgi:hypothetical protein